MSESEEVSRYRFKSLEEASIADSSEAATNGRESVESLPLCIC